MEFGACGKSGFSGTCATGTKTPACSRVQRPGEIAPSPNPNRVPRIAERNAMNGDSSSSTRNGGADVWVVCVDRTSAKEVKNRLEADGMIHKECRMTPIVAPKKNDKSDNTATTSTTGYVVQVSSDCIAVPLARRDESYEALLCLDFRDAVRGFAVHQCPFRTCVLGNPGSKKNNINNSVECRDRSTTTTTQLDNVVQIGLLRALEEFFTENETLKRISLNALIVVIRDLPVKLCPVKLEVFGDDRTLVLPLRAFDDSLPLVNFFDACGIAAEYREIFLCQHLWKHLAAIYNSQRLVLRGEVDPNSPTRKSGFQLVWPNVIPPHSADPTTGPDSPTWITVTEQGIRQSFDLTRVMFSRGNISEKIRFGQTLVQPGDRVLDLYAGIGYFALPALVHGQASHVTCCEWNADALQALRYNLRDNGVEDRATVLAGDCRTLLLQNNDKSSPLLQGTFDRVSLGLLPSSEGSWETAVCALRRDIGGWLHVHGNVPVHEVREWALWLCFVLRGYAASYFGASSVITKCLDPWIVVAWHVEKVKSFAPNVNHYVADVFIGPLDRFLSISNADEELFRGSSTIDSSSSSSSSSSRPVVAPFFLAVRHNGQTIVVRDNDEHEFAPPSCALSPDGVLHQEWMGRLKDQGGSE